MGSLVPRLLPSFPLLAVRTANDGKLDGACMGNEASDFRFRV